MRSLSWGVYITKEEANKIQINCVSKSLGCHKKYKILGDLNKRQLSLTGSWDVQDEGVGSFSSQKGFSSWLSYS